MIELEEAPDQVTGRQAPAQVRAAVLFSRKVLCHSMTTNGSAAVGHLESRNSSEFIDRGVA